MTTNASEQPMLRIPKSANPVPTAPTHKARRIPVIAYVVVLLAVIGVLVVGTQAAGWFRTTGQMTTATGERAVPTSGAPTSDIKGWMTIQQVLDAYPVKKDVLYAHFAVPADTATTTTLSELKESGVSSLDVPTLRTWIDAGARP